MNQNNQLESSVLVLVDALTGLLLGAGLITVDVKTTILAQLPTLINDIIAIIPLSYGIWHAVKFVALSIKKQMVKRATAPIVVQQAPVA